MSTATSERRTLTIEEAAELAGCGRTAMYQEARSGFVMGVPVLRVGRRKLIPRARFEAVLDGGESRVETEPGTP